ncbi:MAG: ATP-binding protein [Firmicutes bacterium]|nr:ATP-binding protein [Bacillota bacterium]
MLALSVLGFHADKPATKSAEMGEPGYYTFSDFFYKGPGDPETTGLRITWRYGNVSHGGKTELTIRKQSEKWMHYERRPKRPVYYLGLHRCVPPIERPVLRKYFSSQRKADASESLSREYLRKLGYILGRPYTDAEVMMTSRYSLRQCNAGARYSGFNMGAGEDMLITLLYVLQNCPDGSLIVVEEVETGLFPEALIRFTEVLQEVMLHKRLQVVMSTHSYYLLDRVPREARILLKNEGGEHLAISAPTTRLAMGDMSGRNEVEVQIYCEDGIASLLIERSLPAGLRRRVRVTPVGPSSSLAPQAKSHLLAGNTPTILLVWDGDVTPDQARKWLEKQKDPRTPDVTLDSVVNWAFLPGCCPPEQWLLGVLDSSDGHARLAEEFGISESEARQLLADLSARLECHDLGWAISQKWAMGEDEAIRRVVQCVAMLPNDPLRSIREAVERVLEGQNVRPMA